MADNGNKSDWTPRQRAVYKILNGNYAGTEKEGKAVEKIQKIISEDPSRKPHKNDP